MRIIVFLFIFLLITGSISFYIFLRGLQSIPAGTLRGAYIVTFWIVALSFIGGRILENFYRSFISDILIWMGSFWLAALIYFLLAAVFFDLVRFANWLFPFYPSFISKNYEKVKYATAAGVFGIVVTALLIGHINSTMPRIAEIKLKIPRKSSRLKDLNIVAASDIHLGTIVGRSRFDKIVHKINSLDPDLVLLPGDIVDEDLAPVIRQNLGEALKSIKSKYGVYAITGNHEYIGGVREACNYLIEHQITMLRDQSVKVADSLYLVGRDDRSGARFNGIARKSLPELMKEVDRNYPVILMDHQPFGLAEAAENGVDLQLSGHTHYGQLWPLNYIVERIYELAWGYKKIAGTHYYVSNGVGTWGPPVRLGNRPEIMQIRIQFE